MDTTKSVGVPTRESRKQGARPKTFAWGCWSEALADHRTITSQLLRIFGAYAGPNSLEPKLIETIMLTVNSVNACAFCTNLHCELARMAEVGVPRPSARAHAFAAGAAPRCSSTQRSPSEENFCSSSAPAADARL